MLFADLPTATRLLRDLPPAALSRRTWEPPTGPMNLEGVRRLCVDVERYDPDLTTLGPGTFRGARIVGLAVGTDDGRRAYYPMGHKSGGNCDWDVRSWARRALNDFRGELVGAKLVYDLEALAYEWGVTFPHVTVFHDVQTAEAVLDEWRLRYSLDSLAQDYLNERKAEGRLQEIALLRGWKTGDALKSNLWQLDGRDVGEYGEGDVDLPLRILPRQLERLEADGQAHIYELERRLIPVLLAMRLRGVRVAPVARIEETRARFQAEHERWAREVKRLLGPKAEVNSSDTLGPALRDRGLDVQKTAPSKNFHDGKWSVTKEFLEKNKGDAAVNAIAAARRVGTLISLTIDSLLRHVTPAGRVHSEYNALKGEDENGKKRGTIARLSSSNPNAQQIPTRGSEFDQMLFSGDFDVTREIRGLYLPDEGEIFESLDFSQIEYRLLVHYAVGQGAEQARERYRSDPTTDYHKLTAELMHIDPEDQKRRKRCKNLNFALCYGAGDDKLAITFNCPVEEAKTFHAEYSRRLPFVEATYKKAIEWAERRGFVETILGRKARFPLWEPAGNYGFGKRPAYPLERARSEYPNERLIRANTYKALNRKLQGSGADIMKRGMVLAHEMGLTAPGALGALLLTVHDEADASVPPTREGREAADELKRTMETCVSLSVPLMVKAERGPSWGDLS